VTSTVAMPRPRAAADLGLFAGSIAVLFWGLGPVFVRSMGVSAPTVIVYRFALGTPTIVAVALALGARFSVALFRQALLPGALFGASLVVGFEAVKNTSVANATLIGNLLPVLVVLVARFVYRERVRGRQYLAVAASVVGIGVVVFGSSSGGEARLWGDFLAFVGLLIWTVYFLRTKKLRDGGADSWSLIATHHRRGGSGRRAAVPAHQRRPRRDARRRLVVPPRDGGRPRRARPRVDDVGHSAPRGHRGGAAHARVAGRVGGGGLVVARSGDDGRADARCADRAPLVGGDHDQRSGRGGPRRHPRRAARVTSASDTIRVGSREGPW
jgi:uncharacterized membrane protein